MRVTNFFPRDHLPCGGKMSCGSDYGCAIEGYYEGVYVQALGTKILPQLWAHLARSMGLPLEAPKEAKRGWDIAALRRGAQSLSAQHAALLGLFCRCTP